jgi:hypothetical protein
MSNNELSAMNPAPKPKVGLGVSGEEKEKLIKMLKAREQQSPKNS